ncbi:unnamed protein product [Fraxinus pennsylvanica]|uniref:NAC domain-containing protein n=1 Tax=Fraxinus pennsylvanica TaxID=56036 RepID=A0AAD1YUQ9_9LAMI|nr:unnamed protein product [Fraxinus pennsylvanica]
MKGSTEQFQRQKPTPSYNLTLIGFSLEGKEDSIEMEKVSGFSRVDEEIELPPGFRFHPTDEELITHYLSPKVIDSSFSAKAIGEVDLNKFLSCIMDFWQTSDGQLYVGVSIGLVVVGAVAYFLFSSKKPKVCLDPENFKEFRLVKKMQLSHNVRLQVESQANAKTKSEKFPPSHQDGSVGYPMEDISSRNGPVSFGAYDASLNSSIFLSKIVHMFAYHCSMNTS